MEAEKRLVDAYRKKLELLCHVCQLMSGKTAILMSNNLVRLEKSLEEEAVLQRQLQENEKVVHRSESELAKCWGMSAPVDCKNLGLGFQGEAAAEIAQVRQSLREVVEEMRHLNLKNMALIENGQLFVETMLSAICPPPTYHSDLRQHHATLPSRLSVEC